MVIDTSALVAIERLESDWQSFQAAIVKAKGGRLSAVSYVEFCMVTVGSSSATGVSNIDRFLASLNIVIVPVDDRDAMFACEAFLRYGKGRSPAKLNLGDLFSYALAKRLNEPLLFKGNDFSLTDIQSAL